MLPSAMEATLRRCEGNTAPIDGVRRFAMDVRELDIDLIDRINPFEAAYAVLAKAMDERTLKQVPPTIAAKRISLSVEEARELALRAVKFKQERGRVPDITSPDAWEKRLAEGVAAFARYRAQQKSRLPTEGVDWGSIRQLRLRMIFPTTNCSPNLA